VLVLVVVVVDSPTLEGFGLDFLRDGPMKENEVKVLYSGFWFRAHVCHELLSEKESGALPMPRCCRRHYLITSVGC
jgi:hypothetical protein